MAHLSELADEPEPLTSTRRVGPGRLRAYVAMARPDYWTKNVLMLPGIAVALLYRPETVGLQAFAAILVTLIATCVTASSNYVINELLDAETDRFHPVKAARPAASGAITTWVAMVEWAALGVLGIALGLAVNLPVGITALLLWVMGLAYNVPPVRLKDWPYLDVLSESANNALRLALGWFAVLPDRYPPFSLILAYWMAGAFLMAMKRFAEFRDLQAGGLAGSYRRSFRNYSEERLLVSSVFYATLGAFFGGMFILRYRLELVLMAPLIAALFAYYVQMAHRPESAAQHPERLYRDRMLAIYLLGCVALFTVLMFVPLPWLYDWFSIEPAGVTRLWPVPAVDGR